MAVSVKIKKNLGSFFLNVSFASEAARIGILGASGCGKSLTLKSIAGIETPDQGEICIHGKTIFSSAQKQNVTAQKRNIGYLFQNYALFPTMTVAQNIAAGLKGTKRENQKRVEEMLRTFQLEGLEKHLPEQLSGGQQQRVALARIMAYEPEMLLLDEPFSALDTFLREQLQREWMERLKDYPGTVILVSHDRDELYQFSEELVLMEQGTVVACGKTKEIFENPEKKEAARLTGCKNLSRIRRRDSHTIEALDWGITLRIEREVKEQITCVGYRAHDFIPVWGEAAENCIRCQVIQTAELPFERHFYIQPEKGEAAVSESLCWFVQRDRLNQLEKRGMPDYLQLAEEKLMLLQ